MAGNVHPGIVNETGGFRKVFCLVQSSDGCLNISSRFLADALICLDEARLQGFCLDWGAESDTDFGFRRSDCRKGAVGTGRPHPARGGGRDGAKKARAGRTRQGVAGQPGTSLAVTASLPCKLPTGLIWHRVFKMQGGWGGFFAGSLAFKRRAAGTGSSRNSKLSAPEVQTKSLNRE